MPSTVVKFDTNMGSFSIELDEASAPISSANFLEYVRAGFYAGTTFHRVIPGFMVQGGGLDVAMRNKPTRAAIRNEADNGLKNLRATVAMARTGDPHSATAQFFVNVADNAFLDHKAPAPDGWGYAVFGKVVEGMDVVDAIVEVPTRTAGMHENVPAKPIVVAKAAVV
ncbi:MAG: peptidyl-prolyl cis-trans isomerase [Deltaproteobacteria bacterium]|nr:peptidyl-prolyl cis-trans isomerase [Deltaproteobacteria bacterium]